MKIDVNDPVVASMLSLCDDFSTAEEAAVYLDSWGKHFEDSALHHKPYTIVYEIARLVYPIAAVAKIEPDDMFEICFEILDDIYEHLILTPNDFAQALRMLFYGHVSHIKQPSS